MGAQPGDALMLTKSLAIEGTAIIAREKEVFLQQKGIPQAIIAEGKNFLHNPGISIVEEARLLYKYFPITAMHGPTEGGFAMGVVEMIGNSKCGVKIEYDQLPILPCTKIMCDAFALDPLGTISSGTLLFTVPSNYCEEISAFMEEHNIPTVRIGEVTDNMGEYLINEGGVGHIPLIYSTIDEITKIF